MPGPGGEGENEVCHTLEDCANRKAAMFCDHLDQENPGPCITLFEQLKTHTIRPDEIYTKLTSMYGTEEVDAAKTAVAARLNEELQKRTPANGQK